MSESIYAPPEADVTAPAEEAQPRYYVVSQTKFLLLSILTLGWYFHYWIYRNWYQVKMADSEDSWPIARGIFYIFFTHSLFADVDARLRDKDPDYSWSPNLIATTFVLLTIVGRIVDRSLPPELMTNEVILASASLLLVLPALLVPAQKAINAACDDPTGSSNSKLTAANYIWLLLGSLVWLFVLLGLATILMPGAF